MKTSNQSIFFAFFFLQLIFLLFSCKKEQRVIPDFIPNIQSISPTYVKNGGEVSVIIKGVSVFNAYSTIQAKLNGQLVEAKVGGYSQEIKVKVPDNFFTENNKVSTLQVIVDGKESLIAAPAFYAETYPRFDTFTPEIVSKGEEITIYGYNFIPDASKNKVSFGDGNNGVLFGEITSITTEQIKVKVPQNAVSGEFLVTAETGDKLYKIALLFPNKSLRILK